MIMNSSDSEFEDLAAAIKSGNSDEEHEAVNDNESDNSEDSSEEKEEPRVQRQVQRKRKRIDPREQKGLDKFLFGDKEEFVRKLEGEKLIFTDLSGMNQPGDSQIPKLSVWQDSDDEDYKKSTIDGDQLKKKFQRITGSTPSWAKLDGKPKEEDSDADDEVSKTVGHLGKSTSKDLPKSELNFKRLANINKATMKEGRISSVVFHPKSTVGIVAGLKGIVSMFAIDGKENKKIHTIKYERYPIHSCKLNLEGDELIIGGLNPFFHTYNLLSGYRQSSRLPKGISNLRSFELSPCGKYMAVIGEFGEVHLLHSLTKELLCTLKQEYQSTSLSFSVDSSKLFSHGDDNEVTIFDLRTQRVQHRFVDDGCVNGTSLAISANGKIFATGSRQGFVNIYNYEDVLEKKYPKPVKAISNLKTEITDLKFNPTTEMLAICSTDADNAVKLVHFPTATVFSNFPSQHDVMGKTTTMAFSPAGGFFATGSIGGNASLYRLRHYSNY